MIEKIKSTQFQEVINYITWQSQAPVVFARILQLENTVNKLIDALNDNNSTKSKPQLPGDVPSGSTNSVTAPQSAIRHEQPGNSLSPKAVAGGLPTPGHEPTPIK